MNGRPEFSPAMLKTFLRTRAAVAMRCDPEALTDARMARQARNRWRAEMRRRAGVTVTEFSAAWEGRPGLAPEPRAALWRAMDLDPAEAGIRLTENGGQEQIGADHV